MKYGAHIFLWTERWTSGETGLFERARSLGLDSLEIAVGDDVEFNPEVIRKASHEAGTELVISPGGDWPMEADISHDEKKCRDFGMTWHKRWIEAGAEAGATAYTGALYAHPGRIEKRRPSESEQMFAAENLHELSEFAAKFNISLVLEPMSHFRTHLVNTPEQVMALIHKADHPNLKVLMDTYHLVTEVREYESGIRLMAERLWGIHACENDRGVPGGGLVPWRSIFSTLQDVGFDGYFILETYNSSIGNFAFSRGMFHDVCPDGDAFVRQGTGFIKDALAGDIHQ